MGNRDIALHADMQELLHLQQLTINRLREELRIERALYEGRENAQRKIDRKEEGILEL